MLFQSLVQIFALPAVVSALAASPRQSRSTCQNPPVRQEWQTLSAEDKAGYIEAIKCVSKKPSIVPGLNSTAYDDFARIHYASNDESELTLQADRGVIYVNS
jgi:tyrosinase